MRKLLSVIIFFIAIAPVANAKIQTANRIFESSMTGDECLSVSRVARESIFSEKFGEILTDGMYDYIRDDIHFTVLCMPEKKSIVLFIAAQDLEVYQYITKFAGVMEKIINEREIELNQKLQKDTNSARLN